MPQKPQVAVDDFNLKRFETETLAGAANAKAGYGFVGGVVGLADDVPAVAREKLAALVIQPQRQMTALVFIGHEFSLKADDKSLRRPAIARKRKRDRLAFGDVSNGGDFDFGHEGRVGGAGNLGKDGLRDLAERATIRFCF